MNTTHSCHGDPRLRSAGGRRAWPWVRSVLLVFLGALLVYPGGIALGLALHLGPDSAPFSFFVMLGLAANLAVGAILLLVKTRWHALPFVSPAALLVLIAVARCV